MPTRLMLAGLLLSALAGCGTSVDSGNDPSPTQDDLVRTSNSAADEDEGGEGQAPRTAAKAVAATPLIPREVLFGNPDKAGARISPDGKRLSYLAPVERRAQRLGRPGRRPRQGQAGHRGQEARHPQLHLGLHQQAHPLHAGQGRRRELARLRRRPRDGRDQGPDADREGRAPRSTDVSQQFPNEILVGLNDRDAQLHDIYRVNIATGERKLVQENAGFAGFVTDDDYRVRFAHEVYGPTAATAVCKPDGRRGGWKEFVKIPMRGRDDHQPRRLRQDRATCST